MNMARRQVIALLASALLGGCNLILDLNEISAPDGGLRDVGHIEPADTQPSKHDGGVDAAHDASSPDTGAVAGHDAEAGPDANEPGLDARTPDANSADVGVPDACAVKLATVCENANPVSCKELTQVNACGGVIQVPCGIFRSVSSGPTPYAAGDYGRLCQRLPTGWEAVPLNVAGASRGDLTITSVDGTGGPGVWLVAHDKDGQGHVFFASDAGEQSTAADAGLSVNVVAAIPSASPPSAWVAGDRSFLHCTAGTGVHCAAQNLSGCSALDLGSFISAKAIDETTVWLADGNSVTSFSLGSQDCSATDTSNWTAVWADSTNVWAVGSDGKVGCGRGKIEGTYSFVPSLRLVAVVGNPDDSKTAWVGSSDTIYKCTFAPSGPTVTCYPTLAVTMPAGGPLLDLATSTPPLGIAAGWSKPTETGLP
jgi:hypothetical protein